MKFDVLDKGRYANSQGGRCPSCVSETDVNWFVYHAPLRVLASLAAILCFALASVVIVVLIFVTIETLWSWRWSAQVAWAGGVAAFATIIWGILHREIVGEELFLFLREDGALHIHTQDPRTHHRSLGHYAYHSPEPTSEDRPHINGLLLRIRNGGYLMKRHRFNAVWLPNGKKPYWSIVHATSLRDIVVEDINGDQLSHLPLDLLLEIMNRFYSRQTYLEHLRVVEVTERRLRSGITAVGAWLKSTKDRRASKVGEQARLLLEVLLESAGFWTVDMTAEQPADLLADLERLVSHRRARQEAERQEETTASPSPTPTLANS